MQDSSYSLYHSCGQTIKILPLLGERLRAENEPKQADFSGKECNYTMKKKNDIL